MNETLSKESILEDPSNQTLNDIDDDEQDVLEPPKQTRKRGKAITYYLFKRFDNYDDIIKEIKQGDINGNTWVFKRQDDDKYRYYCKYVKQGCRAAPYLHLATEHAGNCFVSDEDYSNHQSEETPKNKVDTAIYQKIVELENLQIKPEGIIKNLIKSGFQPPTKIKLNNNNWNKLGKTIQHVDEYYMVRSGDKNDSKDLSREECRNFIQRLDDKPWNHFDEMLNDIKSIFLVKLNQENWKNSICNCVDWLKNYKCCHTIAIAYRLNLQLQPPDIESDEEEKGIEEPSSKRPCSSSRSEADDNENETNLIKKCKSCEMPLKKRKYFYCVNKCKNIF
ncbi:unnamed protein product [Brachionus calyciflorus]|uniref:SWIM-type domain-containing protein n=1 Tax=Brachionus calyciflorus TaxID=104777 RepID=A0A813S7J1_9BILA|nr:unnamed protein product [Brachionus calyciflorus]